VSSATLNTGVDDFIVAHPHLFIDRQLIDATPGTTITTVDPATEEPLGTIADDGAVDIDLDGARWAFDDGPWRRMTPSERLRRAARRSTGGGGR
jgi:acyl-CoA reductase-like NAD-dependent aldehyde dehydrogenase